MLGVSGERVRGIVDAALKRLRASKALCIAERRERIETLAYHHVGIAAWKSGTGSTTEWAVERIEDYDKHQRIGKAAQFMKAKQALETAKAACAELRAQQDDAMRAGNYARFDVLRKKFQEMQMLCFEIESEQARHEAPKRRNK